MVEEYNCQCFSYSYQKDSKLIKRLMAIEQRTTEFEVRLYIDDEHVIAKTCKPLLKFETGRTLKNI